MIEAANLYYASEQALGNPVPEDPEDFYRENVRHPDTQSFWEAAAAVVADLAENGDVGAGQLYYVTRIYPERVTADEARERFLADNTTSAQRDRWSAAAEQLNNGYQTLHAGSVLTPHKMKI